MGRSSRLKEHKEIHDQNKKSTESAFSVDFYSMLRGFRKRIMMLLRG